MEKAYQKQSVNASDNALMSVTHCRILCQNNISNKKFPNLI